MKILDQFKDLINASFSRWIKVSDVLSPFTIESFSYETGVDDDDGNHCWKCITVNKCWFKNEENKKPEKLNYSLFTANKLLNIINALYHPKCHCKESALNNPNSDDIKLIVPRGKGKYTSEVKGKWIEAMGYLNHYEFFKTFYQKSKESFVNGNYTKNIHDKFGFKINLNIDLPGDMNKKDKTYKIVASYTIFPNGKLKLNTHLGGWRNETL